MGLGGQWKKRNRTAGEVCNTASFNISGETVLRGFLHIPFFLGPFLTLDIRRWVAAGYINYASDSGTCRWLTRAFFSIDQTQSAVFGPKGA